MKSRRYIKKFITPILLVLVAFMIRYLIEMQYLFPESMLNILAKLSSVLFIAGIAWAINVFVNIAKINLLSKYDIGEADNLRARKLYTQYNILEKIIFFIVILIAVGTILMLFDGVRNIGVSLFASAGIAGLIIGLAAQKALGTILAGLQIAITQPIRLDDVVIVENEWGWIEEINLTYVVVRIWDKRRLIVPSTYFMEKTFQNWTRTTAEILGTVFIYTDYTIPFDSIRNELTKLLEGNPNWDGKVNVLQVTNAKEDVIELRALMSADSSPKAWDLRVYVREKLIEYIQREHPQCLPRTRIVIEEKKSQTDSVTKS
ncbi:MAG: mechanosensitive ion channel family protein [Candidatus Cloacimonetes bacterium]|nr:mechanosensitive ion channel family protein [Candidatus Cloacimonadota bacterium]